MGGKKTGYEITPWTISCIINICTKNAGPSYLPHSQLPALASPVRWAQCSNLQWACLLLFFTHSKQDAKALLLVFLLLLLYTDPAPCLAFSPVTLLLFYSSTTPEYYLLLWQLLIHCLTASNSSVTASLFVLCERTWCFTLSEECPGELLWEERAPPAHSSLKPILG